jgi:GAF domain-containing protein
MPNNDLPRDPNADDALEQLGRLTLTDHSMESLLQSVADLAKTVMPGNPEASITVQSPGRKTTVVSTGQLATDLDEVQYAEGYGPCLHAATTQQMVEIPDTRVEARWPDYARRAVEHGNLSSLSMPLGIDERRSGALNIYAREPHAFDADSRAAATRFAPYAAVALANMHAYEDARTMAGNLQVALETRAVIDQAKGILMERHKMTADEAFQAIVTVSNRTNRKLRDIADQLVQTGEFPAVGD